jgi:hypothetical protein
MLREMGKSLGSIFVNKNCEQRECVLLENEKRDQEIHPLLIEGAVATCEGSSVQTE